MAPNADVTAYGVSGASKKNGKSALSTSKSKGPSSDSAVFSASSSSSSSAQGELTLPDRGDALDPDLDIFSEPMLSDMPGPLDDYMWTKETHPHVARRAAALKLHPEVKKLYGPDIRTFYWVTGYVLLQFFTAWLVHDQPFSARFWVLAYLVGATCNHALFLSIHEIGHNLAFKGLNANRALSMFANLPIGVPYAISFRAYHAEHHRLQGVDGYDTDLPTWIEGIIFNNVLTKTFFCTWQIFFYAFRPMVVRFMAPTYMLGVNWLVQLTFNALTLYFFGFGPLLYFVASSILAGSLHPCAGHFISEHYVFTGSHETFSYYGPLNWFSFNVGYHNEHHDFPNIPWTRLPELKAMCPELYGNLPYHTSWMMVTYNFIFNSKISVYNRIKRHATEKDLATANKAAINDFKKEA